MKTESLQNVEYQLHFHMADHDFTKTKLRGF